MVLVVQHQVEQPAFDAGQRADEPGGETVGIDRETQRGRPATGHERAEIRLQSMFEEADFLRMAAQALPGRRGGAGLAAHDKHRAEALLQQLHPLRHRRGRDAQQGRRLVEAAGAHHGGDRFQQGGIDH
jgi:hypothetical protein